MVSIVVPIYNEEEIFHLLHSAITESLAPIGEDYEIVYVNDGSRDSSLQLLLQEQSRDPHVVVVDLSRNFGHMGAVDAGLKTAQGDAVVLMDGDLQDHPRYIPEMIRKWREGAQVVTTVRRSRKESRKLLGVAFGAFHKLLDKLSDFKIPQNSGVFGLMDRKAMDVYNSLPEGNRYFPGLRAWVGFKNAIVYYDRDDRIGGEGKLDVVSRIKYALDAIYSFSYKPMRLASICGLICMGLGVLLGIATVFAALDYLNFSAPLLSLFAALALVGGLQLFCLGVVSEYIGRIYDEVRERPLSIINKVYRTQRVSGFDDQRTRIEIGSEVVRAA
jgi:glycosyltransferase involved in cell wall biosynthesis